MYRIDCQKPLGRSKLEQAYNTHVLYKEKRIQDLEPGEISVGIKGTTRVVVGEDGQRAVVAEKII